MKLEKWTGLLKKYRYAALIVLAGMVLMLLPTGGSHLCVRGLAVHQC